MSAFRSVFIHWWILFVALYLIKQPVVSFNSNETSGHVSFQSAVDPATEYVPQAQYNASGYDLKVNSSSDLYILVSDQIKSVSRFLDLCLFGKTTSSRRTNALIIIFPFHEFW